MVELDSSQSESCPNPIHRSHISLYYQIEMNRVGVDGGYNCNIPLDAYLIFIDCFQSEKKKERKKN